MLPLINVENIKARIINNNKIYIFNNYIYIQVFKNINVKLNVNNPKLH